MSHDPYSPCPCGSGKKLKFCCADILPDMIKAHRLMDNQPEAAEKILRDLLARYPSREVIVGELCMILPQQGRHEEAREMVAQFLKDNPDHPMGLIWMARLCLLMDGFEASRRVLHRAFQISSRSFPLQIADLANSVGIYLVASGEYLGGREHLGLAVRLAGTENGRRYLMNLAMLEADGSIPYLLRTPHALLPVSGSDEIMQQDLRARKLSIIGCWEPASILYSRMAEAAPGDGAIQFNLGLCKAWDGRMKDACQSLHQAATLLSDPTHAIQAEWLAQIIDQENPDCQIPSKTHYLSIQSTSMVVSLLEQSVQTHRDKSEREEDEEKSYSDFLTRTASFEIFDRPAPDTDVAAWTDLPVILADVDVLDLVSEQAGAESGIPHSQLAVTVSDDNAERALDLLRSLLAEQLVAESPREPQPVSSYIVREARDFAIDLHRPKSVSKPRFRELEFARDRELAENWLSSPKTALGGKSPLEAAEDASLKIPLTASVLSLDVIARYADRRVNVDDLFNRLHLQVPDTMDLPEGQHCAALPTFHLERLDCTKLSDDQLQEFCNRASMLGFPDMAQRGLDELLNRPAALESFGVVRGCMMRAALAVSNNDSTTMNTCFEKAHDAVPKGPSHFREQLEAEIRELSMRLGDPEDPKLIPLLHRIRDRYFAKLPEIREVLEMHLIESDCQHLLSELDGVGVGGGSLWTPGSDAGQPAASGSGGGLWLPGQD
ncbi:MAG: tetratricopeptide repeat protein [Planctomycetaceae bacterium]|nr:tetratricopeptide repeat protein [Planctomycetaceae bacterium]